MNRKYPVNFVDKDMNVLRICPDTLALNLSEHIYKFCNEWDMHPHVLLVGFDIMRSMHRFNFERGIEVEITLPYTYTPNDPSLLVKTGFLNMTVIYVPWMSGVLPLSKEAFETIKASVIGEDRDA